MDRLSRARRARLGLLAPGVPPYDAFRAARARRGAYLPSTTWDRIWILRYTGSDRIRRSAAVRRAGA